MSLLPPGVTADDIDRVFGSDTVLDDADAIAAASVVAFNDCLSQRVTGYVVRDLEQTDAGEWSLRLSVPAAGTLGKHYIEDLSLALMAFAVSLQMECEKQ